MTTNDAASQLEIFLWSWFVKIAKKFQGTDPSPKQIDPGLQPSTRQADLKQDLRYAGLGLLLGLTAGFLTTWIIFLF